MLGRALVIGRSAQLILAQADPGKAESKMDALASKPRHPPVVASVVLIETWVPQQWGA